MTLIQLFCRRILNFPNVFLLFHYYLPLDKVGLFFLTNLNFLPTRMLCFMFGWNWRSGSGEEDFLNTSMYFRFFVIISPWKIVGPSFEHTWIPFTQRWLVLSLVDTGPVVMKKKSFKICQCIYRNFVIIPSLKRLWPFVWTNLNALYPRMHC